MRRFAGVPTGERIGNYPPLNHIPDAYSGTYRQVFQRHPLPGAGAAEYTYSTIMLPQANLYGAGQELTRGVPAALSPASDTWPDYVLSNPNQPLNGTIGTQALLPSDLVAQFAGKTVA